MYVELLTRCLLVAPGEIHRTDRTSGVQQAWCQAPVLSGDNAPRLQNPVDKGKCPHLGWIRFVVAAGGGGGVGGVLVVRKVNALTY